MPKSPSVQHFLGVFPTLSIWTFLISFSFSIPICFLFYHSRITPKHLVYMLLHWHLKVHDWMSHSISNPYGISMTSNQLPLCCLFLSYAGEEPQFVLSTGSNDLATRSQCGSSDAGQCAHFPCLIAYDLFSKRKLIFLIVSILALAVLAK